MNVRRLSLVAITALAAMQDAASAAPDMPQASFRPEMNVSRADAITATYRQYVNEQAGALVGMTRGLAKEIRAGNLDGAMFLYAPAHRIFERLAPVAKLQPDLDARMNARAAADSGKEADAKFAGFHRIEHGLFEKHSTTGLAEVADTLQQDARALQERISHLEVTRLVLVSKAVDVVEEIAARKLDGEEERYAGTDLFVVEANLEGVREVLAMVEDAPPGRVTPVAARIESRFATIERVMARNTEGCGYKRFADVAAADRAALAASVKALAADMAGLRSPSATD